MPERTNDAIARLTAWIRDYGEQKEPVFIEDLKVVLGEVERATRVIELFQKAIIKAAGELESKDAEVARLKAELAAMKSERDGMVAWKLSNMIDE